MGIKDPNLLDNPDAVLWADFYLKIKKENDTWDEREMLITYFANAFAAGEMKANSVWLAKEET